MNIRINHKEIMKYVSTAYILMGALSSFALASTPFPSRGDSLSNGHGDNFDDHTYDRRCKHFNIYIRDRGGVPQDLVKEICEYYFKEGVSDWAYTYSKRPAEFKSMVGKKLYMSKMNEAAAGYSVREITIEKIYEQKLSYIMKFDFTESSKKNINARVIIHGEDVKWVKREGKWFCNPCGVRARFFLNGEIPVLAREGLVSPDSSAHPD